MSKRIMIIGIPYGIGLGAIEADPDIEVVTSEDASPFGPEPIKITPRPLLDIPECDDLEYYNPNSRRERRKREREAKK